MHGIGYKKCLAPTQRTSELRQRESSVKCVFITNGKGTFFRSSESGEASEVSVSASCWLPAARKASELTPSDAIIYFLYSRMELPAQGI
jgi:hypothetical protein